MDKTAGTLRQMFEWLFREQQSCWFPQRARPRRPGPSSRAKETWSQLINCCTPVEEKDIDCWFPVEADGLDVDFSHARKFLYLPPLEKDAEFVPVLSMRCCLSANKTVIRLRVMLVCLSEDDAEPGKKKLQAVKFRLEGAHGDEQEHEIEEDDRPEGRHDFYHAQLVRDFVWGSGIESPNWFPKSQPSFPLIADCPVTLILCLLLTLYGKQQSLELLKRKAGLWTFLKPYVGKLHTWIKWKELEGVFT